MPKRHVVVLLPGQGAQYPGMCVDLYRGDSLFAALLDDVLDRFHDGRRIRTDWLATSHPADIHRTTRSQPLLFALDYALSRRAQEAGVSADEYLGHSIGEFAAAALAGTITLDDAVRVLDARIPLLADTPAGGMLAVALAAEAATPYLGDGVEIAAVNGPRQLMLAGPADPLDRVAKALTDDEVTWRPVRATSPFHSSVLGRAVTASLPLFSALPLQPPNIPITSAYTGRALDPRTAMDPAFWAGQPAAPVLFAHALEDLLGRTPEPLFVEAGPGQTLSTLVRAHAQVRAARHPVIPLSSGRSRVRDDETHLARAFGTVRELLSPVHTSVHGSE
ncbi:acyltransferase domain-containing protein [Flexivirga sp. ID2601S]|uniref:Acyltransferase domain-containing protein n=1 Tax=Flexivirga aerilata TaxID=1656889 RepID=A0A849AFC4_9MICO|nr:acyltransferase domain-containing protein [Flexivirga aerilata]NNG38276.1 acyltransferase domain-containing protein [Flexivirga aerilata]